MNLRIATQQANMNNPDYKKVLPDLIKRLEDNYKQIQQWDKYTQWLPTQLEYYYKTLALLELLENVTVFYTGFGWAEASSSNTGFDKRVMSFLNHEYKNSNKASK